MGSDATDTPIVVDTTIDGLLFVQSREYCPGAFWAVQAINGAYRCTCPARVRCAHVAAAWQYRPLLTVVDGDPFAGIEDMFVPGGTHPQVVAP